MSLRFNLDNESDRMAWEHLQSIPDSKNKAVIDALNASFEQANTLADLIRQTIRYNEHRILPYKIHSNPHRRRVWTIPREFPEYPVIYEGGQMNER